MVDFKGVVFARGVRLPREGNLGSVRRLARPSPLYHPYSSHSSPGTLCMQQKRFRE